MITPRRTGSGALGTPQSGQRPSSARRRLQQATSAGGCFQDTFPRPPVRLQSRGAFGAAGRRDQGSGAAGMQTAMSFMMLFDVLGAKNATPFSHDKLEGPTSSGKRFEPASPSVEDPFPKFLEDAGEARKSLDFSPAGVSRISEVSSASFDTR
eukprot:335091-Rhodomonas_salina.1